MCASSRRSSGVLLFRKLGRGVTLTDDGAAYLEPVARAFDIIGEATASVGRTSAHRWRYP